MPIEIKNKQGAVLVTVEQDSLEEYLFYKLDLPDADLRGLNLYRARFYKCNLKGADFSGANCRKADFQVSDLTGAAAATADFSWTNLLGTILCNMDLTSTNLKWAHFKGTKYNKQTKWPKGIDPKKEEMILLTEAAV